MHGSEACLKCTLAVNAAGTVFYFLHHALFALVHRDVSQHNLVRSSLHGRTSESDHAQGLMHFPKVRQRCSLTRSVLKICCILTDKGGTCHDDDGHDVGGDGGHDDDDDNGGHDEDDDDTSGGGMEG